MKWAAYASILACTYMSESDRVQFPAVQHYLNITIVRTFVVGVVGAILELPCLPNACWGLFAMQWTLVFNSSSLTEAITDLRWEGSEFQVAVHSTDTFFWNTSSSTINKFVNSTGKLSMSSPSEPSAAFTPTEPGATSTPTEPSAISTTTEAGASTPSAGKIERQPEPEAGATPTAAVEAAGGSNVPQNEDGKAEDGTEKRQKEDLGWEELLDDSNEDQLVILNTNTAGLNKAEKSQIFDGNGDGNGGESG